jgi:hypothetical protein
MMYGMNLVSSDESTGGGTIGGGGLSAATIARFRSALTLQLEQPQAMDGELRAVIRAVAREARGRHLRAEQLVIIFKNIWESLPEVSYTADAAARELVRQQLVTLCIEEYYRG